MASILATWLRSRDWFLPLRLFSLLTINTYNVQLQTEANKNWQTSITVIDARAMSLLRHVLKCTGKLGAFGKTISTQTSSILKDPLWHATMTSEAAHDINDSLKALVLLLVCLCIAGLQMALYLSNATRDMKNTHAKWNRYRSNSGIPQTNRFVNGVTR